jgi:hypothetical protein
MSKEEEEDKKQSFWSTVPGLLTALAAIITAIGGLVAVLHEIGIIAPGERPSTAPGIAAPARNSPPRLLLPRNNAMMPQPYMQAWLFEWDKPEDYDGVQQYELLVFQGPALNPVIHKITRLTQYTQAAQSCSFITDNNRSDWGWQVRVRLENGAWSAWSPTWTFDVSAFSKELLCQQCPKHPLCQP